jgi:hypothetical protein
MTPADAAREPMPAEVPLVVVRVEDAIDSRLAGHSGAVYESPPQTREQALALVELLLGCRVDSESSEQQWVAAVAGGRRIVTVTQELGDQATDRRSRPLRGRSEL